MTLPFRRLTVNVKSLARRLIRRSWPGLIAVAIVVFFVEFGAFQAFQSLSYNLLFQLRGPISWDDRIVVVEIDDTSLQTLDQFPLERKYYAQLLNQLSMGNPSVIGIDIVFSEADDGDRELASEMDRLNRVVLALGWSRTREPILPVSVLSEQAVNLGHVLYRPSSDGITRVIAPYVQNVPSLSVAIAQAYDLIKEPINIPTNHGIENRVLWINWPGSSHHVQSYSFHDVLLGQVDPDAFQNKIVLVGVTASGSSPLSTPFNRNPPMGAVYLHAAVLSNILQQNMLHRPGKIWTLLILFAGGPLLGVLTSNRMSQHRWLGSFLFCIGWILIGVLGLSLNILLPIGWPIALVILTNGLTEVAERWRANRILYREVNRLWNTYHPDLIEWHSPSPTESSFDQEPDNTVDRNPDTDPDANKNLGRKEESDLRHPQRIHQQTIEQMSIQPIATQRASQLALLAERFGRSQSLHAAIAQNLSIGVAAADWNGTVWMCNPVATTLLNLHVGDVLETCLVPSWGTPQQWAQSIEYVHQVKAFCWEVNRSEAWYELRMEPLIEPKSSNGLAQERQTNNHSARSQSSMPSPFGLLLLIRNITASKRAETEIRGALAEAVELSELKTRFVSMASHELRTPLSIMRTCVELLKAHGSKLSPDRQLDYLERMENTILGMKTLVDDVLILGRTQSEGLQFAPKSIDLREFCQEMIDHFQPEDISVQRIHLAMDTQASRHNLDENLLSHILENLLSNALKYSPAETFIYLNIFDTKDSVVIEVCDRGIGMPSEYQAHIFEEFYRGDNVGKIPGTGLGLSIVKRCVDLHRGTIYLNSQIGIGTVFRVQLPTNLVSPM